MGLGPFFSMIDYDNLPFFLRNPNIIDDFDDFVQSTKSRQHKRNLDACGLYRHSNGSINNTPYSPCSNVGRSLSVHCSSFESSLEPGVSRLVMSLWRHGLTTYTSCEGHLQKDGFSHLHVGILADLDSLKNGYLQHIINDVIEATTFRSSLHEMVSPRSFNTLEIYFPPEGNESFIEYRDRLNECFSRVL